MKNLRGARGENTENFQWGPQPELSESASLPLAIGAGHSLPVVRAITAEKELFNGDHARHPTGVSAVGIWGSLE